MLVKHLISFLHHGMLQGGNERCPSCVYMTIA